MSGPATAIGVLAFVTGWWAGVLYDRHRMDFKRHPNWMIALLAALVGVAILFASYGPLEQALLSSGMGPVAAGWIRSAIIALYVTALAPWLFRTARVAR